MTQPNYQLPKKIPAYMRRLEIMYRGNGQAVLHEVVCNSIVFVQEGVLYDNWNGGTSGHLIQLFLTEETLSKIEDFDVQKKISEQLQTDLNECCRAIPNEYVEGISIELRDDNDGDCKQAVNPFTQPIINPESLDIWKPGHIRLFISHRDEHKKKASDLAAALEGYGISSFVAHDTIEPMEKWQSVIQKAMLSAEIMLAFIFHGSGINLRL